MNVTFKVRGKNEWDLQLKIDAKAKAFFDGIHYDRVSVDVEEDAINVGTHSDPGAVVTNWWEATVHLRSDT